MKFAGSFMFAVCIQQATCQLGNEPSVSAWAADTQDLQDPGLVLAVDTSQEHLSKSKEEIAAAKAVAISDDQVQKSAGVDDSMATARSILDSARAELKSLRGAHVAQTDPAFEYEKEQWKGAMERSNDAQENSDREWQRTRAMEKIEDEKEQLQRTQPTSVVAAETHSFMAGETASLPYSIKPVVREWKELQKIAPKPCDKAAAEPSLIKSSKDITNNVAALKDRLAASLTKAVAANKILSMSSDGAGTYSSASTIGGIDGNGVPQYTPSASGKNGRYGDAMYDKNGMTIPATPNTQYSSNLPPGAKRSGSGRNLQYVPQSPTSSGVGGVVVNINLGTGGSVSTSPAGVNVGAAPVASAPVASAPVAPAAYTPTYPEAQAAPQPQSAMAPHLPGMPTNGLAYQKYAARYARKSRVQSFNRVQGVPGYRQPAWPGSSSQGLSAWDNEQYHVAVQTELQKMVSQTVSKNKELEAKLKHGVANPAATLAMKAKMQKEIAITKLAEQNEDAYQEMEINHLQKQVGAETAAQAAKKAALKSSVADVKKAAGQAKVEAKRAVATYKHMVKKAAAKAKAEVAEAKVAVAKIKRAVVVKKVKKANKKAAARREAWGAR